MPGRDEHDADADALSALGFRPFFREQLEGSGAIVARVVAEHRGAYEIAYAGGEGLAQLSGRLHHDLGEEERPGVGDWVVLKAPPSPGQTTVIDSVLARETVFLRGAAGRATRGQVIAANVDRVLIVCGLDADFNLRRIERYLARVWASGAQPAVVLNKADLCDDPPAFVAEVEASSPGTDIFLASALHGTGVDAIVRCIAPTTTAALVGSSGAGKSTLINAMLGEERMATREVRTDGRGQHTTTHRQLLILPQGGLLIDTPGMRELQLFDEEGIGTVFADIAALSEQCRFQDCRHASEPGCAVKSAVEDGTLDPDRFAHYQQLEREAQAYERRHDEHLRRKSERVWGQLYDEAARLRKWKRGE